MRFFMVSHGQALALNKDFDSIDDIWDCQIGFSETRKLCDISSNGQRYLFDIGWGFLVCDFGERKSWSVPYFSNAVNKSLSPSFLLRAIFSPCGRAVAVMYGDGRLMLLDSKHGNVVFDHKVAMETLEVGTDGVIFEPKDFGQIKEIAKLIDELSTESYVLRDLTITNVEPVGSGDRVCIDTTTMMKPGEGMLIGSYSKAMFFIHSESLESEYVASRPFRVNAGPVQAYVMVPGNKTRYLSELETGDEVLIVDKDGKTKTSIVGRSKIEKRPLLLIEAEYEDMRIKSLVQNAETIRLVDENNEPISVSVLEPGMKVKGFIDDSARHFGMAIDENIIEQ